MDDATLNRAAQLAARQALGEPMNGYDRPRYKVLGKTPTFASQEWPLLDLRMPEEEKRRHFDALRAAGFTVRRVYFHHFQDGSDAYEAAPIIVYDGRGAAETSYHKIAGGKRRAGRKIGA